MSSCRLPIVCCLFLAIEIITCLATPALPAPEPPPDSSGMPGAILRIVRLNGDCRPDTIRGRMNRWFQYLPADIFWGGSDSLHTPPCPGGPPSFPRRRSTHIEFPPLATLTGSLSFDRVDPDTLRDLVIHYSWRVGDSLEGRDTGRTVVIFAQQRLDTVATINVSSIAGFQMTPFFAMELHVGAQLVEPAVRDVTGTTSYVLMPVQIPSPPPKTEQAPAEAPWQVRVAPNPARGSAEVTGRMIPAGEYDVEVVNVNGALERRVEASVAESGELFRVIDLRDLPSGYYVVVLHARGPGGASVATERPVAVYPIIITR